MSSKRTPSTLARYNTRDSPFLDLDSPFTAWELFKLVVLSPLIVPRVLGALWACTLLACMSALAAWRWPEDVPLSPARRKLTVAASKLAGVVLWCLGFSIRVRGKEHLRRALKSPKGGEERCVLIFNHVSWADAPLVMYLAAASGVSRASNKDIPLIGTCIRAFQNIYVEREKARERKERHGGGGSSTTTTSSSGGVTEAIKRRVRGDPRWPNLILAPEGTCGDGKCLLRFRTGAFVPGAPVLPILLRYENRFFNPAWGIVCDERVHFVRALCQFRKRVDVLVLPPYYPDEEEKRDASLFASNVRRRCAEALGNMDDDATTKPPTAFPLRDDQGYEEFAALLRSRVSVSADGRRVTAPEGVVDEDGFVDLTRASAVERRRKKDE